MKLFWPKYPALLRWLYPQRISRIDRPNSLYLTFDDGPVPEVTPWVLDQFKKYNARATFFCIGDNVKKHRDIFRRIIREGHTVGNHTYNHLDGWKTSTTNYLENIRMAEKEMQAQWVSDKGLEEEEKRIEKRDQKTSQNRISGTLNPDRKTPDFPLFRPPYGKIRNSQARKIRKAGYKIVMWDVISGDYDKRFSPQICYRNIMDNAGEGSTIVLHDSEKAFGNLQFILPEILEHYNRRGFEFGGLKDIL